MEVLFVEAMDPKLNGHNGIRSYVKALSTYLVKMKIKTTLCGIKHNRGELDEIPLITFIPIVKKRLGASGVEYLINLMFKVPLLKLSNSTIIHAQRPDVLFPFTIFHKKIPMVCTLHGMHDIAVYHKKGKIFGKIYELFQVYSFKKASILIAVSEETKNLYLKRYPWIKEKIIMIPVGIDIEKFKPMNKMKVREKYGFSKSDKIIMYVGRLEKEKSLDSLLKAFKDVKTKVENVKLILVGDGREKEYLENVAKELKLKEVRFMGALEHDRIPEIMNCADLFILTSLYEGSPTVVKEALACGIPVVSTDVGDARDYVIDNKTGYLIKNHDYENISKLLIRCLEKGENMKENCVKIAQKYSWDKIAERTMEVYRNV
jgi:glycosyltransferase involved in cell wall biosynthesis